MSQTSSCCSGDWPPCQPIFDLAHGRPLMTQNSFSNIQIFSKQSLGDSMRGGAVSTRLSANHHVLDCDWAEARRRCLALAIRQLRFREDAEEAAQEALARGWLHAESCRNPWNPISWLMTITRRECARLGRRHCERQEARLEARGERGDGRNPTEAVESRVDLRKAVAQLSDEEQRLLELRYIKQLTQVEVAEELGWPEGTVKTKLHRIRARLRPKVEVGK